ncbi:DNA mismatch repair endonuclease MutL [Candidatus Marinamargulisbacteria bacterium SCGC AG-439-L15]|nr:DNA mismatch repair endonuclease MutL [Candidatus Marinamargulisbacteria bacterium SCGC AG-439-L15]
MPIQCLDETTINKIAAGEVIDRPVSVVKELVENSLDSKASQIKILLESGGIQSISIIDNGQGIEKDDLCKAPLRHATSKITCLEDIYAIGSFGFRGEALSSICHVGRMNIQSKSHCSDTAYGIEVYGSEMSEPELISHPQGTTITVRDLFKDIPVRRKYLKTPGTELSYISNLIRDFSLLFPEVGFVLMHGQDELLNTVGIDDSKVLLYQHYGNTLKDKLLSVDGSFGGLSLTGWVSDPTLTFSNRSKQIYAVNGRLIKSPILQKIVSDVYRDVIPHGRFPLVLLNVTLLPEYLDVNIHPKKSEVKFLSPDSLFKTIPSFLKRVFQKEHAVFRPQFQSQSSVSTGSSFMANKPSSSTGQLLNFQDVMSSVQTFNDQSPLFSQTEMDKGEASHIEYLHLFDTYIVVKAKDALWLLDQHAVHERILYERLKQTSQSQNKQPLLISELVTLSLEQMVVFERINDDLREIGFLLEVFGKDQVMIREVPSQFSQCAISDWLLHTLDELSEFSGVVQLSPDQKEVLQLKACKAAIKAGKKMADSEVRSLLHDFICSSSNFTCPHGRPLFVKFEKSDLEKLFLRR